MATVDQRVSYVEGVIPSLATKEDLAHLEARLIKWLVVSQFLGLTAVAAVGTAIVTIIKFLG